MCKPAKISRNPSAVSSSGRSKEWWAKSVAKRTASFLEDEVDTLTSGCKFLSQVEENENILRLERSQVRINKLLGEGAFSEVYSVSLVEEDASSTSSKMVMKHLRRDLLAKRKKFNQAAADLVLETQFLARLDHPNIIKIRGYAAGGVSAFSDGSHDSYFVLLDEVKMTLSDRIHQWKSDERSSKVSHLQEKIQYAMQIASALEYLHERNIIYRDLKPDNIGIAADGTIKLLDLGLCREIPESDVTDEVFQMSGVGTRRYMAPEVALGKGYNLKADVYGFAMVMYELFSSTKPFEMYNREMHKQLACADGVRPNLPSCWPKHLKEIITCAWDGDSAKRPTMADMARELEEFANEPTEKHHKNLFRSIASRFRGKKHGKSEDVSANTVETSSATSSIIISC